MTNSIVPTKTDIPGVELIYLEDRDIAGIHIAGLARLLNCHDTTVSNAVETVKIEALEEVELQTPQGLRMVKFILESGVIQVLKTIRKNKRIKESTREVAEDLYDRFAMAGFKLYTMLNVAPDVLRDNLNATSQSQTQNPLKDEIDIAAFAVGLVVDPLSIHENLKAGIKANAIAAMYPRLKPAMEESKKLLAVEMQDQMVIPTELAAEYSKRTGKSCNAIQMNQKLKAAGLQYQGNKDTPWKPTKFGEEFSVFFSNIARTTNKTVQQLKWSPSVLDVLS